MSLPDFIYFYGYFTINCCWFSFLGDILHVKQLSHWINKVVLPRCGECLYNWCCDCCDLDSSMLGWRHVMPASNICHPAILCFAVDNFLVQIAPQDMSGRTGSPKIYWVGWLVGCLSSFNSDVKLSMILLSSICNKTPSECWVTTTQHSNGPNVFIFKFILTYILQSYFTLHLLQTSWLWAYTQLRRCWG